eukprot:g4961.t1
MLASISRATARSLRTAQRGLATFNPSNPSIETNWSLNADGITPSGNTHRNEAVAPAKGKKGKGKGGKAKAGPIDHTHFDAVTASLERAADLWVHDGEVGTARGKQVGMRLVTDCPAVAAEGASLMLPVKDVGAINHKRPLMVYHTQTGVDSFVGADVDDTDEAQENWTAVVLMGGSSDSAALKTAIASAAGGILGADVKYQTPKNGFDILVAK